MHPPCGFRMLVCAAATMFVRIVFHILLCSCVTPPAISLLTVAPLAPRKNSTSSGARQEGVVRSASATRNIACLPNMAVAGEDAGAALGNKLGPQLELRAESCR